MAILPTRATVLPTAQRVVNQVGQATWRLRMSPEFLICGAQRCGTTSMYQSLRQHRAILRPVLRKGVHYFDVSYVQGMAWYRSHFPLLHSAHRRQKQVGEPVKTFESSPYYLFHPHAAHRIAADLPLVRIVILVRDPVERAYSAYAHEFARGYETESFESALELEASRLAGQEDLLRADPAYHSFSHQHHGYVARGHYIDQITRMVDAVGRERVHVVDAEDFFTDPWPTWREVVDFLALSADPMPEFRRHNARPRSTLAPSVRRTLEDRFADSDERLAQWWGRIPSWRR
ncbi:MAG: sulfotransferase domain-containing protein [Mycobacterium sp.]|nr:sulfotransferase domain-containing protein [Mycobacterium sp.]